MKKPLEVKADNIYLDDSPLQDAYSDKFELQQVAEVLKDAIKLNHFPLHISLLGSWGSGKTTTINILKSILSKNYKLKTISVWKFADDSTSLHRKIIREIERKLGVENPEGMDQNSKRSEKIKSMGLFSSISLFPFTKENRKLAIYSIGIFILISFITLITPLIAHQIFNNLFIAVAFYILFIALQKDKGFTQEIKNEITPLSLKYNEQYEYRFQSAVERFLGKEKNKKLILVFDDLDRLPPKQLYGALNTIKTFLNSKRCAFIIPCDEEVLESELKQAFDEKDMYIFDVTEYLNKTFDLTIRLPNLETDNMTKYAKELVQSKEILWSRENKEKLDEIIFVLIHSNVRTPRHVKKVINAYAADWELAKKRDNKNSTGKILTKDSVTLALFSVLKTDFGDFYKKISEEPNFINDAIEKYENIQDIDAEIVKVNNIKNTDKEEDEDIFFTYNNIKELVNFLIRVSNSIPDDIRPYIYFNNQELNPLTGRNDLLEIKNIILDGRVKEFENKFKKGIRKESLDLVLESTFQDIQSSLAVNNVFKILFEFPELSKSMEISERLKLHSLLDRNIEKIVEYPIKDVLEVFNNLIEFGKLWDKYWGLLKTEQEKYIELLKIYTYNPTFFEKINSVELFNLFNENIAYLEEMNSDDDSYYVPQLINSLPDRHPLNDGIDWYDSLTKTMELYEMNAEDKEDDGEDSENEKSEDIAGLTLPFNLSEWANNVNGKTNEEINISKINNILSRINFNESDSLQGILGTWLEVYNKQDRISDVKNFINLVSTNYTEYSSLSDTERFANFIVSFGEDLSEQLSELLIDTLNNSNEEYLNTLIEHTESTVPTLDFCVDEIHFKNNDITNSYATTIIYAEDNLTNEHLATLINKVKNAIFEADKTGNTSSLHDLISESSVIYEYFSTHKETLFNIKDKAFWLNFPSQESNYYRLGEIFLLLFEGKYAWELIKNNITFIISNDENPQALRKYKYSDERKILINNLISLMIDYLKDKVIWEEILESLTKIKMINNEEVKSVFEYLESSIARNFINEIPEQVSLDNAVMNSIIHDNATIENSTHLMHVINRWGHFSKEQRIDLIEKVSEENITLLVEHIEKNSETKYIDELSEYEIDLELKQNIVIAVVQNINTNLLSEWINSTFIQCKESELNYWAKFTFEKIIQHNISINMPAPDLLKQLLKFKDERTLIVLDLMQTFLTKRDRGKYRTLRESILDLEKEEKYVDLVGRVKRSVGWRSR